MSYTNGLDDPTLYFNTKLYTGNGSTQSITGVGFKPDMTWIKARGASGTGNDNHCINDIVRAKGSFGYPMIHPNLTASEYDPASGNEVITDFQSDGFDLGGNENSNYNSNTYASWNWLASNTTASNTDGSITSSVSANTTSGFSIVSYTGNGTSGATIGHSLTTAPACVIIKRRNSADAFNMYHQSLGATKYLKLDRTDSATTSSLYYNDTAPTSSVFSVGNETGVNNSSDTYIAYCFAEKKGFSKFGSYTGNGSSTDGTFVYTGFKPAFVMGKYTGGTGDWWLWDNKRLGYNRDNNKIKPNTLDAETTENWFDMYSNGFKFYNNSGDFNYSGYNFIYMAFAENPFVTSTGIPTTAR